MELFIVMMLAAAVYILTVGYMNIERRPKLDLPRYSAHTKFESAMVSEKFKKIAVMVNQPFAHAPYLERLRKNAEFLQISFNGSELLLVKEIIMICAGVLTGFLLSNPLYGIAGAFIGFVLPDFMINAKIKAKKEKISEVFPETIDLLDLCIGAGLDFLAAIRWVIDKSSPNSFTEQLAIVLNEIQIGKSRTDAIRDMAARVQIPDLNSFSRMIVQAERMGISIEEALRNLSEDTRESRFQRGERFAIKASLKILIPLMFFILPVILIVVAGPVIIQFSEGGIFGSGGGVM